MMLHENLNRTYSDEVFYSTPQIIITDESQSKIHKHLSCEDVPADDADKQRFNRPPSFKHMIKRKGGSYKSFFSENNSKSMLTPGSPAINRISSWLLSRSNPGSNPGSNAGSTESINIESVPAQIRTFIQNDKSKKLKSILTQNKSLLQTFYNSKYNFMHEAAFYGSIKCISVLLQFGFDLKSRDEFQWTVIHAAVLGERLKCLKHLMQKPSCNINVLNSNGLSPLHIAVYLGDLEIIKELTRSDANPIIESENNETPFQLAIFLKKHDIVDHFISLKMFHVQR